MIRAAIHTAVFEYVSARREAELNKDETTLATLEAPDILVYLWMLERFHWRHLPLAGGLEDQPHLLMFELDCADQALQLQARLAAQQAAAIAAAGAAAARAKAQAEGT